MPPVLVGGLGGVILAADDKQPVRALKAGFTVLYRSIFDVVRDFLHDEAFAGQDKVLARYLKPDLLIIDDMGMKRLPKQSGEYLFEIIMRRYEVRSTVMTSNRPLEDWGKLIGDVPAATAILDRFLHHAELDHHYRQELSPEAVRGYPERENRQHRGRRRQSIDEEAHPKGSRDRRKANGTGR